MCIDHLPAIGSAAAIWVELDPDHLAPLPGSGFASRVDTPAPEEVIARSTWKRGCPVAVADLSWVRVAFWGFDQQRHTGELLVNRSVAGDLVGVFRRQGTPPPDTAGLFPTFTEDPLVAPVSEQAVTAG